LLLAAILLWGLARGVFLCVFVAGLLLQLFPASGVDWLLNLPLISLASPVLRWSIGHSASIFMLLAFFMLALAHRKLDRLVRRQKTMAHGMGGILNYLEVTGFKFAPAIEEATRVAQNLDLAQFWKDWKLNFACTIFGKFLGGDEGAERMTGMDPFDAVLKRGEETSTLREDVKRWTAPV